MKELRLQKTKLQENVEKTQKSSKILEEDLDALKKHMQSKDIGFGTRDGSLFFETTVKINNLFLCYGGPFWSK